MRWRSWQGLLAFAVLAALIGLTAWGGCEAWIFDRFWVPLAACASGLVLLFAGRRRAAGSVSRATPMYAAALCVFQPVLAVTPYAPWTPPAFAVGLAPLAWAGVTGMGRGQWVRACGAWLVLFGQYFALIYNASHSASGMGVYSGWVF